MSRNAPLDVSSVTGVERSIRALDYVKKMPGRHNTPTACHQGTDTIKPKMHISR